MITRAATIAAICGLALAAHVEAQTRALCSAGYGESKGVGFTYDVSYNFTLTNAEVVEEWSWAQSLMVLQARGIYCGPWSCPDFVDRPAPDSEVVFDSLDFSDGPVLIAGGEAELDYSIILPNASVYALGGCSLAPLSGDWSMWTHGTTGWQLASCGVCTKGNYFATGSKGVESAFGIGGFVVSTRIAPVDPNLPVGITGGVWLDGSATKVSLDSPYEPPCCDQDPWNNVYPPVPSCPAAHVAVVVSSYKITLTGHLPTGQETAIHQGVYAVHENDTRSRLGFFTDAGFDDGDPNDNTYFSVDDHYFPLVLSAAPSTVDVSVDADTFVFDGDVDADGMVCKTDREMLAAVNGSTIGDGLYVARADFNLDGSVTAADFTIFNTKPCSADWNCDGVVDNADFTAFQAAYTAGDPEADINGDGLFLLNDFTAYQGAYVLGC